MSLIIDPKSDFVRRHVGPGEGDIREMLEFLGYTEMEGLVQDTVPDGIRLRRELDIPSATPEHLLLDELREIAKENRVFRSYIGMGYHDTVTPGVIARNILENPGWYTQYTPYQAEISQGRLEALLNFQTMVTFSEYNLTKEHATCETARKFFEANDKWLSPVPPTLGLFRVTL